MSPGRRPEGGRLEPVPLPGRDQVRDQGGRRWQELQFFGIQFIWIPDFHDLIYNNPGKNSQMNRMRCP